MQKLTVEQKIGRQIQKMRKEKGYTQQQFAEIVDLSTNYLSDIERGKSFPRADKLVAIINALECSADELFADVIDCGYQAKASRLAEMIGELSPKNQQLAFDVLEVLLNGLQVGGIDDGFQQKYGA